MKKVLALILAILCALSVFSSCKFFDADDDVEEEKDAAVDEKEADDEESEPENEDPEETEPEETEPEFQPVSELIEGFEEERLVPKIITAERFESAILSCVTDETDRMRLEAFYTKYDTDDDGYTMADVAELVYSIPAVLENDIYILNVDIVKKELDMLEDIITKYCPEYTHEHLAADYLLCGYTQNDILNGVELCRNMTEEDVPQFMREGYIVPYVIESERFDKICTAWFTTHEEADARNYIMDRYILLDGSEPYPREDYYNQLKKDYPIINRLSVYVLSPDVSEEEIEEIERILAECAFYDVIDLFYDYIRCGYFWDKE